MEFKSGSFRGSSFTDAIDAIAKKYETEYVFIPDLDSEDPIKITDFLDEENEIGKMISCIE